MTRSAIAVVASAAAIVLLAGFVHGTWTQRWYSTAKLDAAVERLGSISIKVDGWTGTEVEAIKPQELKAAGVQGCWMRNFTSDQTGQSVLVVLLCGRTGQMCVHRPENCYPGQGYDLAASPLRHVVKMPDGAADAEFWTARFAKPDVTTGGSQLRIYWAWDASGQWKAPEYPRWTFSAEPYLYKLYLVRVLPMRVERMEDDPAAEFLRRFLPELTKALAPA